MSFFDASRGYASGLNPSFPLSLFRSSDGGRSWAAATLPLPGRETSTEGLDLQAGADGTLWLAGSEVGRASAVWRLAAGATQWERLGPAPAADRGGSLQFTSANRGFMFSAAGLSRTDDGGRRWQTLALPAGTTLNAMFFADDRNGWLAGNGGRLLHTRDGGDTWTVQASGTTNDIVLLGALDAYTVWAAERDVWGGAYFSFSATGGR
jgi:photosystem II stability/assembly factor-like uncharacterized protein